MAKATETASKEVVKDKAYYNELVEVELFKDNDKYKDDVFVAVNGVGMIVPRGEKVKIPRKYALAITQSERQDKKTAVYTAELADKSKDAEKNI